jgi:rRNA processing protein Krr1/Pno1
MKLWKKKRRLKRNKQRIIGEGGCKRRNFFKKRKGQ